MVLLLILATLFCIFADASARRLLEDRTCVPLAEHLGVFAPEAWATLQKDPHEQDLVKLINRNRPLKATEKITFFMPTGELASMSLAAVTENPDVSTLGQVIRSHIVTEYLPFLPTPFTPMTTLSPRATLLTDTTTTGRVLVSSSSEKKPFLIKTQAFETCVGVVHIVDDVLAPGNLSRRKLFFKADSGAPDASLRTAKTASSGGWLAPSIMDDHYPAASSDPSKGL